MSYSLAKLTRAIQAFDRDGELGECRVLRKKDRQYMARNKTDKSPHAAFIARVSKWLTLFIFSNVGLFILSAGLCGFAVYELAAMSVYPNSILLVVVCGVLCIASIGGLYGSSRLKSDLDDDDDGEETPAQRFVEVYFWVISALSLVLLFGAILVLSQGPPDFESLASQDPVRFEAFATSLNIQLGTSQTVVDVNSTVATINLVISILMIVLFVWLMPTLYAAVQIVTTFEIMEGALAFMTVLSAACSFGLIYLCSDVYARKTEQALLVEPAPLDDMLSAFLILVILLSVGVLLLALLGFLSRVISDYKKIKLYYRLAFGAIVPLFICACVLVAPAAGSLDGHVNDNCAELVQSASEGWLASLRFPCTKYYSAGTAADDTIVSSSVTCNVESEKAFAWEYSTVVDDEGERSCSTDVRNYGCLALGDCCNALQIENRLGYAFIAILLFVTCLLLGISAFSARFITSHWMMYEEDGIAVAATTLLAAARREGAE